MDLGLKKTKSGRDRGMNLIQSGPVALIAGWSSSKVDLIYENDKVSRSKITSEHQHGPDSGLELPPPLLPEVAQVALIVGRICLKGGSIDKNLGFS